MLLNVNNIKIQIVKEKNEQTIQFCPFQICFVIRQGKSSSKLVDDET